MIDWQVAVVLALVVVLLFIFLREILPVAVTALLAPVVLALTSILTPQQALAGFSNEATVTVLAMFVVSAGVQRTGLVDRATDLLLAWAGRGHRRQLAALGLTVGPISGFMNNTPVMAIMIPSAFRMAAESGRSPSKLLMPISSFAMLGGLLTLIGTSTNILGNSVMDDLGVEPFSFFDFAPIGAAALAAALVYFVALGPRLLPDRGRGDAIEHYDLKGFLGEFVVRPEAAGRGLSEAGLVGTAGIQVLRISRDGRHHDAPGPDTVLEPGDRLLLQGSRERLASLAKQGLVATPEAEQPLADGPAGTAEIMIPPGSPLVGSTLEQVDFRRRHGALVLAVRRQESVVIGPLASAPLAVGDVLLVRASPQTLERLRERPEFLLTRRRVVDEARRRQMPVALAIVAGLVLVASLGVVSLPIAGLAAAVAMVLTGCLGKNEFLHTVHWDIVLMLAGLIPLGIALAKTGAAQMLASGLVHVGGLLTPLGFLIMTFILTVAVTAVVSNNASVVLLLPVAVAAAASLDLDPRPVCMAVIVATSTDMITPIGYQTNTMVYAPGGYRFSDFFRVGGLLTLVLAVLLPLVISTFYPL